MAKISSPDSRRTDISAHLQAQAAGIDAAQQEPRSMAHWEQKSSDIEALFDAKFPRRIVPTQRTPISSAKLEQKLVDIRAALHAEPPRRIHLPRRTPLSDTELEQTMSSARAILNTMGPRSTVTQQISAFKPSAKPQLPPSGGVPGAPTAGSLASRRSLIMPWILGGLAIAAAAGTGAHLWLLPGSLLPRALAGVACGLLETGFANEQLEVAQNHSILYWAAMYAVGGIGLAAFAPTLMATAIGTPLFNRVAVGVGLGLLPTAVAELMPARGLAAARIVVKQANRVQAYLPRLTCAVLVGASFLFPTYPVVGHVAATALHTRQVTRLMASTLMTSRRCNGDEARRAASLAPQILLNTALPLCWTFGAVQARLH